LRPGTQLVKRDAMRDMEMPLRLFKRNASQPAYGTMSLSPRPAGSPEDFVRAQRRGQLDCVCHRWLDSSAGIMPSVRHRRWNAAPARRRDSNRISRGRLSFSQRLGPHTGIVEASGNEWVSVSVRSRPASDTLRCRATRPAYPPKEMPHASRCETQTSGLYAD